MLVIQYANPDAPARGCPQPDPDPPATDGAAQARYRGRRRPAGPGAAEYPGAGRVPRHQSEHGGARDRGSPAERVRGGAAGQGRVRGPNAADAPIPDAPGGLSEGRGDPRGGPRDDPG